MDNFKKYGYLVALLIAFLIRFYNLGLNPVAISHDEIHDLVNAKSMAEVGKSAPGTIAGIFNPKKACLGNNCVFGELISYLLIPWMKVAPFDITWSKIPFLLASLTIVYYGGKFFENLFQKKEIGVITAILIAINPWAIHFGRTAFENLFTFAFYFVALYFFSKGKGKNYDLVLGILFAVFGFLSYMGAKPLFPFLFIWAAGRYWVKNKKMALVLIFLSLLLTISYLKILPKTTAGERLKEVKVASVADLVNEERRVSLEIPLVRDLVINKYLSIAKVMIYKFFGIFSPNYLFNQGETGYDAFIISEHPYLYLIEAVFLILGIIFFARENLKMLISLLVLILFVPVGSVISNSGVTYGLRSGLMFPLLLGLVAGGIYFLIFKTKLSKLFTFVILAGYCLSFCYFFLMYFYRMPFEKSAGWFFHERVLIDYLKRSQQINFNPITVVVENPVDFLYLYAFYTGKYSQKEFIKKFNQKISSGDFKIDNLIVVGICPEEISKEQSIIIEASLGCFNYPQDWARINEPRDNGQKFVISNDFLCRDFTLPSFVYPRNLRQFKIEKLSRENFCKTWLTNPSPLSAFSRESRSGYNWTFNFFANH